MAPPTLDDIGWDEVCFDCDGGEYPFLKTPDNKGFVRYFNLKTGSNYDANEIKTYDIGVLDHDGFRAKDYIKPYHLDPNFGAAVKPYSSAIHLVDLFYCHGIRTKIVSSRDSDLLEVTQKMFARDFKGKVRPEDIHLTQDKVGKMKEIRARLIVEDSYANAREAADAGFLAVMIDHDYNLNGRKGVPKKDHPGIFRLREKGLLGLIELIPSLERRFGLDLLPKPALNCARI